MPMAVGNPGGTHAQENARIAEKSDFTECPMLALTVRDHDAYRRPSWCSVRCDRLAPDDIPNQPAIVERVLSSRVGPPVLWPRADPQQGISHRVLEHQGSNHEDSACIRSYCPLVRTGVAPVTDFCSPDQMKRKLISVKLFLSFGSGACLRCDSGPAEQSCRANGEDRATDDQ